MATFTRAEIDKEKGRIILQPGKRYFFDTDEKDVFPTDNFGAIDASHLIVGIPNDMIGEVLRSGRGQVMVSVIPTKETVIGNLIAQDTGFFYELPDGMSLLEAQRKLYGDTYDKPRGLYEWLATHNPNLLGHMIDASETVKETVEEITDRSGELAKIIIGSFAGLLGLYMLLKLTRK